MGQILSAELFFQVILMTMVYVMFCKYQRILLKGSYFSVQDIIFSRNVKRAVAASISRLLYIFITSMMFSEVFNVNLQRIELSILFGSFLLTWPYYRVYQS